MPLARSRHCATALVVVAMLATATAQEVDRGPRFADSTADSGIDFLHARGNAGAKQLPETMGAGVAWVDLDFDGRLDLYLVQSGPLPGAAGSPPGNVVYRNLGNGRFARATTGAEDAGYGMGVAAADYDADGWADLFVSNFGPDALYRNNGDGTFSRAADAGVEDSRWSVSASWSDFDLDGLPDLFVAQYVVYDVATAPSCGEQRSGMRSYCHIDLFDGEADSLYRNLGDGRFENVAVAAGVANPIEGKGLGVAVGDLNDDGWPDVYIANDTQQNFLYANRGDWTFEEQGLFSGAGYSEDGKGQAGMGTSISDLDGDQVAEILVTNFAFEGNNLYRAIAPGAYLDDASALGFAAAGVPMLSFGVVALDADADGDREIVVASGHILDNVDSVQDNTTYEQPNHLFDNRLTSLRREALAARTLENTNAATASSWRPASDLFVEVSRVAGSGFAPIEVTRGLAYGDADQDGFADLALVNSGGPARLLRNLGSDNHRLVVRLRGTTSTRGAHGARVRVIPTGGDPAADGAAGFGQVAEVTGASSYCSQNAADLYFGLASSPAATVEIRWADGTEQRLADIDADQLLLVYQGRAEPLTRPLNRP